MRCSQEALPWEEGEGRGEESACSLPGVSDTHQLTMARADRQGRADSALPTAAPAGNRDRWELTESALPQRRG